MKLNEIYLNNLINNPIKCDCGKTHEIDLQSVIVKSNAINELPVIMEESGYNKAFIVADVNTYEVAGKKVEKVLQNANLTLNTLILNDELIPDEKAVGSLFMTFDDSFDIIIAIGTGTLNDLVKYFSYTMKKSYYIIGTAPSMDGFISTSAAMTKNNLKTTFLSHVPEVFIGDLNILAEAPMPMITAGFADILGKYTCLVDWELSSIINDEYYCEYLVEMVTNVINSTIESYDGLQSRDKEAIEKLTFALLITGIAMSFAGNSRPASGSEHHMSHFWEILFQYQGKKPVLHGTKVGIGTILSIKLYEYVYEYLNKEEFNIERIKQKQNFSFSKWENEIKKVFPSSWEEIVDLEKNSMKNSDKTWETRIITIESRLGELRNICTKLPSSNKIEELIKGLNGPIRPVEVGLDGKAALNAIIYGKEIRNRYTVLQFLWDLDLLEEAGQWALL